MIALNRRVTLIFSIWTNSPVGTRNFYFFLFLVVSLWFQSTANALSKPVQRNLEQAVEVAEVIFIGRTNTIACDKYEFAGNPPLMSGKKRIRQDECAKEPLRSLPFLEIEVEEKLCDRLDKAKTGDVVVVAVNREFKEWSKEIFLR